MIRVLNKTIYDGISKRLKFKRFQIVDILDCELNEAYASGVRVKIQSEDQSIDYIDAGFLSIILDPADDPIDNNRVRHLTEKYNL